MCGLRYKKIKQGVCGVTPTEIALKLIQMDKGQRTSVLAGGIDLYLKVLLNIANDIYESCIADYYGGYSPRYYNRHGNIEGFNLYRAGNNDYSDFYLGLQIEEDKLLPYGGKKGDKRGKVLMGVLNGLRGGSGIPGWPMEWNTNYPNNYSSYRIWYSGENTIKGILDDFAANVTKDTSDILWQCIARQI